MTRNLKALGLALVAVFAFSAMAASAASASPADFKIASGSGTASAEGTTTQEFVTDKGTKLTCVEAEGKSSVEGTATVGSEQQGSITTVTAAYNNCHATILKIPTTVDMNGCQFRFNAGRLVSDTAGTTAASGNTATGSVDIVNCNEKTPGITITVGAEGKTCHIDVPEQNGIESVHYTTTEAGGVEHVLGSLNKAVVKIDYTGGSIGASVCPGATGESTTGTAEYTGSTLTTAKDTGGEPTNFTIVGT